MPLVVIRFRLQAAKDAPPAGVAACWYWEGGSTGDRGRVAWMDQTGFGRRLAETTIYARPGAGSARTADFCVGLGPQETFHPGALRRAMAALARRQARTLYPEIRLNVEELARLTGLTELDVVRLAVLGAARGVYEPRPARTAKGRPDGLRWTLIAKRLTSALRTTFAHSVALAETITQVRQIANRPGNLASPSALVREIRLLARRHGLKLEIWNEARLHREGCGALLAVAQGSHQPPFLIRLTHGTPTTRNPPVALVGKTITFDTGGISIKPARSMEWMKFDKSGGMAVLAAMIALAQQRYPHPVVGFLAVAENMPGSRAVRPGDVIRSRAGLSVEVINTDAEGRLVLADALDVAAGLSPSHIIDLATLTGAAVTALGCAHSALMGTNKALLDGLQQAGRETGERLWPLPLLADYAAALRSPFADLRNTGDGTAGAIIGGMFLQRFVPASIPWAHVDLTAAWDEKEDGSTAAGANLFGTELLCRWLWNVHHA